MPRPNQAGLDKKKFKRCVALPDYQHPRFVRGAIQQETLRDIYSGGGILSHQRLFSCPRGTHVRRSQQR